MAIFGQTAVTFEGRAPKSAGISVCFLLHSKDEIKSFLMQYTNQIKTHRKVCGATLKTAKIENFDFFDMSFLTLVQNGNYSLFEVI